MTEEVEVACLWAAELEEEMGLGNRQLVSRIVAVAALSFLFKSGVGPKMVASSPYAAGSWFSPNDIGTDPLSTIITYYEQKVKLSGHRLNR